MLLGQQQASRVLQHIKHRKISNHANILKTKNVFDMV
jgi:hypothetical protein